MYVAEETLSVPAEVVAFLLSVRQEAEPNEVRELVAVVADHTVRLLLFAGRELDECWSDVDSMLPQEVKTFATLLEFFLVFFSD